VKVTDSEDNKLEIKIHEGHLIDWVIKIKVEENPEPYDSIRIEGFGLMTDGTSIAHGWIYDAGCRTYDQIKFGDHKYKIYDIIVNNDTDAPINNEMTNENRINWTKMYDTISDYKMLVDPPSGSSDSDDLDS